MSILVNQSSVLGPELTDDVEVALLSAVDDDHGGVIVELKEPMDPAAFHTSLRASISNWKKQEGFWYHHAEPSYLMLVCWLPNTEHTIPVNASHRVGVGAFVMNDKREVLVVQEKNGILRGLGLWKFPSGVVEQGEDIHAGVIREVKEETGIDTEFIEVLAFRQSHKSFFGKSDLFFVCMLRPLSHDIYPQELEIEAAQWMPVEEYAAQPLVQKHELLKYILDVGMAKIDKGYSGFSPVSVKAPFSGSQGHLYLNSRDLNLPRTVNMS
ncbi:nudix hydrolase 2-like isoform X2 [Musa acuminata AAA Group]|uniref:nudix hydrolase 2-like isoform X2 n=1 Tax=Musa acuminata AAA Group TaxID=214697 RepID=UPI0031DE2662